MKQYYTYIMSSQSGTLYIGITSNLHSRVYQHKHKLLGGFTAKYSVNRLVYVEYHHNVRDAIAREKQLKGWTRRKKLDLINSQNPQWLDLSDTWEET